MSAVQPISAPAGFYPDPSDARVVRWWDGTQWTPVVQPAPPGTIATRDDKGYPGRILGIWAFIASLFLWPVGLILGLVAMFQSSKVKRNNGLAIAAVIISAGWVLILIYIDLHAGF